MQSNLDQLTSNVASLQQDMAQIGTLVERLDITIVKLTEVSSNVSQLLAVQVNRMDFQEKTQEKIQTILEQRRQETDTYIKDLNGKIDHVEKDLQSDMSDNQNKILEKIEEFRKESKLQHESLKNDTKKAQDEMNARIRQLEKWMWIIVGAATILSIIFNASDHLTALL